MSSAPGTPPPPYAYPAPPARRTHPALIALIVVGVLFFALLAIIAGYLWYGRSHHYGSIELTPIHLRAALDASFAGGVVDYHFKASPQPGYESDIRDALQGSTDMPFQLVIKLLDPSGATLCTASPRLVRFEKFDSGIDGVKADGSLGCNLTQFHSASRWDVTYNTPRGENVPTTHITYGAIVGSTAQHLPYPAGTVRSVTMRGTDYLSGVIDLMQPDSELYIRDDADLSTARHWQVSGPVIVNCQDDDCIVLNTRQGGSIHVRTPQ